MRRRARQLLDSLDSPDLDVDAKVGTLSVANRQRVEIAKALSQDAKVLIMDEPTAALADADVRRLMAVVKRLRDRGVGIIYVSHKLPEIFELADRVTVLRDGALIGTRPIAEVTEQTLVAMMVGREIDHLFPKPEPKIGETVLEVDGLSFGDRVRDISFELRRGEILGVAGLVGSGRTELALTIFGITPATSGTIELDGQAGDDRHAAAGAQPRHRLRARGPRPAGPRPADDHRAEHLDGLAAQRRRAASSSTSRAEAQARPPTSITQARHPRPRPGAGRRPAVGRQPAEGRARQVARDRAAHPDHGRADARHRRRRQGRNPRADEPARAGGHGDPDDLERAAGGPRHERPHAGDARRPARRRPSTAPTRRPKPSAPR